MSIFYGKIISLRYGALQKAIYMVEELTQLNVGK